MMNTIRYRCYFFFTVSLFFLISGTQAAPPEALDELIITPTNTAVTCYILLNDSDADSGDTLSLDSFDATSAGGGTIIDNGDGTLQYTPGAGFSGLDTFSYTITDGNGGYDIAMVRINVNTLFDPEAARNDILNGVTTLGDPGGPGWMVVYGKTAFSISHKDGSDRRDPMIAAASLGSGKILAMPDHQWLNMDSQGSQADAGQFYLNSIAWLAGTTSQSIKIVVTPYTSAATWLSDQGFTNVVQSGNYATELSNADVLIGWLGSSISQSDVAIIQDFVRDGGGLFICDYGIGYDWWWGKALPDAPGNRVLRPAGMGFTGEWPGMSLVVDRSSGQTSSDDVIDMLEDSSGYSSTELDIGAKVLDRMFQVLAEGDSLLARLDEKFYERIDSINPTPSTPVSDSFEKALLRRESTILANTPVNEIVAHRTAEAVYGTIPGGTPRITRTLSFNVPQEGKDTRGNDSAIWLSTGLYAAPGEIATVTVAPAITSLGLKVKVNGDWNDISGRSSYLRMPYGISREFAIDQKTKDSASAFGGLLWVVVPQNTVPGAFDVTFENVIEAPYFILGQDTNIDWISTLRNNPAPWAELVSENMIITLPKYMVEDLDQAEELMTFWNDGVAAQDDLGNWTGNRTRPMRMYSMIQTAWGGGYAGYPIGGWGWDYGDYAAKEAGNCWGEFHETGHWHQSGYWTDGRTGEVTVNIFTMRAIEAVCDTGQASSGWGNQWVPSERVSMYLSAVGKGGFDEANLGERLVMYSQLKTVFGWSAFKNTFQTYLDDEQSNPSALPTTDPEEWDQWMTRFSREVGCDLSPFFVDWDYGVSQTAIDSLSDLPEWNMLETLDDIYETTENTNIIISDPTTNDFSFEGTKSLASIGEPVNGTLQDNGNGTYTYSPNPAFKGFDLIEYIAQNGYGNSFTNMIRVTVARGDKLKVYYTLDTDDLTGDTVYDMSGTVEFDADLSDATTNTSGHIEQAFTFDGVNDYVEIPALDLYSNAVTITAWVKRNGSQSDYAGIIFSRNGSTVAGLNFRGTTNELGYHWNDASNTYWFDSNLPVPDNQWAFVALIVEPSKATLYVNNESITNNVSHSIEEFNGVTCIGRDQTGRYFYGSIDEVSIWNRALSPTEIQSLYTSGRSLINGLPLFESDPFTAADAAEDQSYQASIASVAQDPEGDELTFSKVSGPAWLTVQANGSISGTPNQPEVGLNNFIIQTEDALGGTQQATLSITVRDMFKGDMGLIDFAEFSAQWLQSGCVDFPACNGCDLDGDSDVDINDLALFTGNWLSEL